MSPAAPQTKRYSPDEAVRLLEEAQCAASPADVVATVRDISLHLRQPHPAVTVAALDLLQIHPLQTIPHLPSLIPASPAAVHSAVEAFADLLSADRTLLVPIIAALPLLPLTPAHHHAARATLSHALRVVDAADLPAVVHAITRLAASTPATARWAARALHAALTAPPPHPHTVAVLAHVLPDLAGPRSPVAAAARTAARTAPPSWLHLVLWLHALRAPTGPYAEPYAEATEAVRAATRTGLLLVTAASSVRVAAPALRERVAPEAVRALVRIVMDEMATVALPALTGFVRLVQALLVACPFASRLVADELLVPRSGPGALVAEAALLAVLEFAPAPSRRAAAAAHNLRVSVAAVAIESLSSGVSAWTPVLVKMRKGLLFGDRIQRERAIALSREVATVACDDVVLELVSVLEACVVPALNDPIAVAFLGVLSVATMRAILPSDVAGRLLSERVSRQCPAKLLSVETVDGVSPLEDGIIQIDIGVISEQSPAAAASVISSSVALMLTQRLGVNIRGICNGMMHATVLVPVVCIPIYEAVEDCDRDFALTRSLLGQRSRRPKAVQGVALGDLPTAVAEMETRDLLTAITAFAVGMSVVVGVLNVASNSLELPHRALSRRTDSGILEEEKDDMKVMWAVLERLTEVDRMLNALLLGVEVLKSRLAKHENADKKSIKAAGRSSSVMLLTAVSKAERVREAVLRNIGLLYDSSDSKQVHSSSSTIDFPRLSLNAALWSVIAVPDETGLNSICDLTSSKPSRDVELARIDKLLLRHLFSYVAAATTDDCLNPKKNGNDAKDLWDRSYDSDLVNGEDTAERDVTEPLFENDVFGKVLDGETVLDDDDDIFYGDPSEEEIDNIPMSPPCISEDGSQWAEANCRLSSGEEAYLRSSMSLLRRHPPRPGPMLNLSPIEILHSAEFAALLLDKAAVYTAVARSGWRNSAEDWFLSNIVSVSGFALRCFAAVLRSVPLTRSLEKTERAASKFPYEPAAGEEMDDLRAFVIALDQKLGVDPQQNLDCGEAHGIYSGGNNLSRTTKALIWIAQSSIDAVVAGLALEAILVLCEYGCIPAIYGRYAVLQSLTTVYECDSTRLWTDDDLSSLLSDAFGEWCRQRRSTLGSGAPVVANKATPSLETESSPWIFMQPKRNQKTPNVAHYRLSLFFDGMPVPWALREGCAWMREIAMLGKANDDEDSNVAKDNGTSEGFVARVASHVEEPAKPKPRDSKKCEVVLDMLGFREVIGALLQIVHIGLSAYHLRDMVSLEETLKEESNPVAHVGLALDLLRGILQVYQWNRQTAIADRDFAGNGGSGNVDASFDHVIVTSASTALQLTRLRLDELVSWYSNENTEISAVTSEAAQNLECVVGRAAAAVWQCSELGTAIKMQYSSVVEGKPSDSSATLRTDVSTPARKIPSFEKRKGKRPRGDNREEDVSKARKMLPRLNAQCDAVMKEAQKLAKAIGVRRRSALRRLAPAPPEEDQSLQFGCGIGVGGDQNGEESELENEGTDINVNTVEETGDNGRVGFHARRGADGAEVELGQKTVTVHFNR